ncbi:MAG: hypothetical protein ILNGONEN_00786 [Syntrophorhabdaceae bacterium]|nr:hypothetical protein [Syntrophorhabdaceae bacterium]
MKGFIMIITYTCRNKNCNQQNKYDTGNVVRLMESEQPKQKIKIHYVSCPHCGTINILHEKAP